MARNKLKNSGGFSMLEMVIVLVIASLLLGVFLVRMGGMQDQKKIETAKGDLRTIQTAINAYFLNHHSTFPNGADWQSNDLATDDPRILRQVLYDPFQSGNIEYSYFTSSNGKYYVVFSYGPNGTADITGINNSGRLTGQSVDDIFISNGSGAFN